MGPLSLLLCWSPSVCQKIRLDGRDIFYSLFVPLTLSSLSFINITELFVSPGTIQPLINFLTSMQLKLVSQDWMLKQWQVLFWGIATWIIELSDSLILRKYFPSAYFNMTSSWKISNSEIFLCQTKQCVLVQVSVSSIKAPCAKAMRRGNDLFGLHFYIVFHRGRISGKELKGCRNLDDAETMQ